VTPDRDRSRTSEAGTVFLRPARPADVPFLTGLLADPEVAPYMAAGRVTTPEAIAARIARAEEEPDALGVVVIEVDGRRAGTATWERVNVRSRIASLSGFAVDPSYHGRAVGLAASRALQRHLIRGLGFHRVQMEVYAFNERALRLAERAEWVREGVRRKAYQREGTWVDGVLFGVVEEDLVDG
jgi:RimJ/RimL family protein N-acetyltransferase